MAARKNTSHSENTKGEIKASQLLNRLFSHANDECDMTASQIQAAKIFIAKYKADLKAIEISGDADNPLTVINKIERVIIDSSH